MVTVLIETIAGRLTLNVRPYVFPILGLKVLSFFRAGQDEKEVRHEAIACTAGAILGGVILVLRSFGSQIGWASQFQDPAYRVHVGSTDRNYCFQLSGPVRARNDIGWVGACGKRWQGRRVVDRGLGAVRRYALHRSVHGAQWELR
ncbi:MULTISPECIES: hypothetical protein [unclassified Bradyrhizobium]|uniref:hypothetical protein n=1 Tax=unclassified Bradyrhizobium TaxID=2631580 RepID=UPI002478400F|nr:MULTISPECIES: hypothetical protein [unclassified Bradyrhizobium]WGS19985.1 hypothetical protein MTX22_37725 [Bradyrhizobium sp. ISRA463]WGS26842.1 hypothetical protein MTX19_35165 [Bradyrhizobium sp. ISRA464]